MLTIIDAQRTDYKSDKKGDGGSKGDNGVLDLADPKNVDKLLKMAQ